MGAAGERRVRPRRRPPVAVRALLGVSATARVVFTVALMLSDRAPGALRRLFGDAADRLSARIDAGARVSTDQLPDSDVVVHIVVWATATALVALTVWSWRGLAVAAAAVLATSVIVELSQGIYSTTRVVESADLLSNAAGVGVGAVVAASAYVTWSAAAWLFDRS